MTHYMDRIGHDRIKDLMFQSYQVALRSPDPSSQNGALLYHVPTDTVVAEACNTFPEGVEHSEERWHDRAWKYPLVDHAEASVLMTAFRQGVFDSYDIRDMAMICPWAACSGCTGVIIGFGLRCVITHKQGMFYNHGPWVEDVKKAQIMMAETKDTVAYELFDGPVGDITIRRDGKPFQPDAHFHDEFGPTIRSEGQESPS